MAATTWSIKPSLATLRERIALVEEARGRHEGHSDRVLLTPLAISQSARHVSVVLNDLGDRGRRRAKTLYEDASRRDEQRRIREWMLEDEQERLLELEEERERESRRRIFLAEVAAHKSRLEGKSIWGAGVRRRKEAIEAVLNFHKREKNKAGRAERIRLQALKNDDEEAYTKMVQESKNERLQLLLSQTDGVLDQLANIIQADKREIEKLEEEDDEGAIVVDEKSGPIESGVQTGTGGTSSDKYLALLHKVQEEVVVQPRTMVQGNLRPYQLQGVQWLVSLYTNGLNGILADEMGLGKTIQSIGLIAYLMEVKGVYGPHMLVTPKSVLPNWANEMKEWCPHIKLVWYEGSKEERAVIREEQVLGTDFHVLMTHYDLAINDAKYLGKVQWHHLIVDEGHRLKNEDCRLAKVFRDKYSFRFRLLLTGTPLQNKLHELWSLLNFLLPNVFNSSETFDEWFNAPFGALSGEETKLTEEEEILIIRRLHKAIRPFLLRRVKKEVINELPKKHEVVMKTDLSAWQKLYYRQIMEHSFVAVGCEGQTRVAVRNKLMQLRKVCNHPYIFLKDTNYQPEDPHEIVRASGKFALLDNILPKLKRCGHRVLIFSQMTEALNVMETFLEWRCVKYLRLDGETKQDERIEAMQLWNKPESPFSVFILSTRAGGLGLNLQTADTVILFDSDWNPMMDQQAEDRAHRYGQKKEVRVFILLSENSVEEAIFKRAQTKRHVDSLVIQAGKFNQSSTASERRELLEELVKKGVDGIGGGTKGTKINQSIARTKEEFEIFEEMDRISSRAEVRDGTARPILMEESELHEWLLVDPFEDTPEPGLEEDEVIGLSGRRRKSAFYGDISDAAFLKVAEEGMDFDEAVQKAVKRRRKGGGDQPDQGDDA